MLRSQLRHVTVAVAGLLFFAQSSLAQFTQQGPKLIGAGAAGPAQQGYSIALSADGNTAIIGGPADPVTGAAWIFARSRGVWTQQGPKLVGVPDGRPSFQGWSVALSADGNTAILGAPDAAAGGTAWVFTRSGGTWTQQGSNLVYVSEHGNAQFGWSVALSGDGNTALVGGRIGEARVYTRAGSVWTQQGPKLVGIGAVGGNPGYSVALSADGNTAILGGPDDNNAVGAAWIFTRSGGLWNQQGPKLVGSGAVGGPVHQGHSVALSRDGTTAIVGGPHDNSGIGAAWVFTYRGNAWVQQGGKLVGTGPDGTANQGWSVALSGDGNTAMVGGPYDTQLLGAAWVFTRSVGVWTQHGPKLVGTGAVGHANQGWSVAISSDGNTAVLGGSADNSNVGAAWFFVQPMAATPPSPPPTGSSPTRPLPRRR